MCLNAVPHSCYRNAQEGFDDRDSYAKECLDGDGDPDEDNSLLELGENAGEEEEQSRLCGERGEAIENRASIGRLEFLVR